MKLSGAIAFVLLATTHASKTKHHQLKDKVLASPIDTPIDQFDLKKSLQYNTHKQDDIVHRNLSSLGQLEKLQNDMNDAVASGDYIKAGELQKQFNALANTMSSTSATAAATTASTTEDDRSSNDSNDLSKSFLSINDSFIVNSTPSPTVTSTDSVESVETNQTAAPSPATPATPFPTEPVEMTEPVAEDIVSYNNVM